MQATGPSSLERSQARVPLLVARKNAEGLVCFLHNYRAPGNEAIHTPYMTGAVRSVPETRHSCLQMLLLSCKYVAIGMVLRRGSTMQCPWIY